MTTPLLILHATAGAGHTRAAQAIAVALEHSHATFEVLDTLDYTSALFRRTYTKAYLDLVQAAPNVWGHLYARYDVVKAADSKTAKMRLALDKLNSRRFVKMLAEKQPQTIVCTHFLALELLSDLKSRGEINIPVHAVITDVSPHAFWVFQHIDHYYVASDAGARELECKGVPAERIHLSGIPVDPIFANKTPAVEARAQLGLPERPTVLLLSGGFGVGPLLDVLESFAGEDCGLSLIVVAGKNAELEAACREKAKTLNIPVTVHGFVRNIHQLMDAADVVVTKPGGLTSNEVLAKGKPMVLVAPIPGQEQRNCEYLLEEGAAVRLYDTADAAWYFKRLLADAQKMNSMRANAERIAKPYAANDIALRVLANLKVLPQ